MGVVCVGVCVCVCVRCECVRAFKITLSYIQRMHHLACQQPGELHQESRPGSGQGGRRGTDPGGRGHTLATLYINIRIPYSEQFLYG